MSVLSWPPLIIAAKLALAMICGGAIGVERELNRKPAGLRTNVLICFGAALYMIVSRHISGGAAYTDPARLAAQVVAGIGFLGAGVILQARGSITGLTTAATIFVVGAVGISIGEGLFSLGLFSTISIILVLVVLRQAERAEMSEQAAKGGGLQAQKEGTRGSSSGDDLHSVGHLVRINLFDAVIRRENSSDQRLSLR